jgi:hypothetical protein
MKTYQHTRRIGKMFIFAMLQCVLLASSSFAHQSPSGCNANNLNVNIAVLANNVTNGTVVTWQVTVQNPVVGTSSCDVTLGTNGLVFTCPGPDGLATGTNSTLIPGSTTLPPGFGPFTFNIQCPVNITNGALTALGRVSAPGSVVHKNPLQDDDASVDKSISVALVYPCLSVTKQCLTAQNISPTEVRITYSGSVSNCSPVSTNAPNQNILFNVQVYNDQPAPNTLLFTLPSLMAGSGTNFTLTYTNSSNICGPFNDT